MRLKLTFTLTGCSGNLGSLCTSMACPLPASWGSWPVTPWPSLYIENAGFIPHFLQLFHPSVLAAGMFWVSAVRQVFFQISAIQWKDKVSHIGNFILILLLLLKYLFIWLHWVLVESCGIFSLHSGMWYLVSLNHQGSLHMCNFRCCGRYITKGKKEKMKSILIIYLTSWKCSRSVMFDSLQPHGLEPARPLRPRNSPV